MDVLEVVASHIVALAVGAVGMRYQDRLRRRRRDEEHVAEAARAIVTQLRSLKLVVTKSRDVEVSAAEIVDAWRECATAIAETEHRLPRSWRHLRRSIRAALGELFGGPAWADISYGAELQDVADFDGRWWDYAVAYYGYVADGLARIADRPEAVNKSELLDFDTWLAVTGRHGQPTTRRGVGRNGRRRLRPLTST